MAITSSIKAPTFDPLALPSAQFGSDFSRNSFFDTTDRGQSKKMRVYLVQTNGVSENAEISTDLLRVTSGYAFDTDSEAFVPVTVKPKSTDPKIAVISGLLTSTLQWVIIFGA